MHRIRRAVAATALLSLALVACSGSNTTTDPTPTSGESTPAEPTAASTTVPTEEETTYETVSLSMGIQEGSGSNLPAVVAREAGLFEKYGLQVEPVALAGSALLGAVASGDIQFFNQAVQLVGQAIQQDVQLRFFAGNYPVNWSVIIAPTSADLPSTSQGASWQEALAALEGKTLGVAALGATQEHWITALLRSADLPTDSITLLPVGVGPSAIAAIEGGQVDAIIGYSFVKQQLMGTGEFDELFTFDETGTDVLGGQMNTGWAADVAWLDANPDVVERLTQALAEAMEWAKDEANADRLHEILAGPDFGIADEAVREVIIGDGGVIHDFSIEIDCGGLERAANFFVDFGTFEPDPPINCDTAVWTG